MNSENNKMKEFLQYTWGLMKQDFKDMAAPFVAINNWVDYWSKHKS